VGDGGTFEGINENNTIIDFQGLLRIHMPPYYNAVIESVSTIMVSYSSWNGVKMHANHFLVTDFLKNKLKFKVCAFPVALNINNLIDQSAYCPHK
jgi:beta-glucosidase